MNEFIGYGPYQLAVFGMTHREHIPSAIMPWEWPLLMQSVDDQVTFELHMIWQYALEGRDWLRRVHPWGPHWYFQLWEPSPNDVEDVA